MYGIGETVFADNYWLIETNILLNSPLTQETQKETTYPICLHFPSGKMGKKTSISNMESWLETQY